MLSRSRSETCMSDLALDELLVGELTAGEMHAAGEHIKSCAACSGRLDRLRTRRDDLPLLVAPPSVRRWPLRVALGGGAIAAAVALFVLPGPAPVPSTGIKGSGQRLTVFVKRGADTRKAGAGEPVRAGDTLVFATSSGVPSYVAVLGREGPGKASVYFPSGERAVKVDAGREVVLPFATVIDDAAGAEQIYGLFCPSPEPLEPLRDALAGSGVLPVPAGCAIDGLTLAKAR
jgi:hypothetical protein